MESSSVDGGHGTHKPDLFPPGPLQKKLMGPTQDSCAHFSEGRFCGVSGFRRDGLGSVSPGAPKEGTERAQGPGARVDLCLGADPPKVLVVPNKCQNRLSRTRRVQGTCAFR